MPSKLVREDAQEWLESLQQVGEGWWRQVGLAVKAGAPRALGMDRREFTQQIGQRLIDPRDAVVELFREKHSQRAIADVLGIAPHTVARVLYEEGLVKTLPRLAAERLQNGDDVPAEEDEGEHDVAAERDRFEGEIEDLNLALEAAHQKALREKEKLQDRITKLQVALGQARREAEEAAEGEQTEEEVERARRAQEARIAAINAKFAPMYLSEAAERLGQATDAIKEAIKLGVESKHDRQIGKIEKALDEFERELAVVQMAGRV